MPTIDHESAVKLYAVLTENLDGGISDADFVKAFTNALGRKIGKVIAPAPAGEDNADKTERFFERTMEVAFENRALPVETVIEIATRTAAYLRTRAKEDAELGDMFEEDAAGYDTVVDFLHDGNLAGAIRRWRIMDTAARDYLEGRTPEEEHQLQVFIYENEAE
jgi:hypothetical protein